MNEAVHSNQSIRVWLSFQWDSEGNLGCYVLSPHLGVKFCDVFPRECGAAPPRRAVITLISSVCGVVRAAAAAGNRTRRWRRSISPCPASPISFAEPTRPRSRDVRQAPAVCGGPAVTVEVVCQTLAQTVWIIRFFKTIFPFFSSFCLLILTCNCL